MEVELKSDWQKVQVELQKSIHGYELKNVDDEMGYVDYVAEDEGDDRKLLRVIVGPKYHASKAFVKTIGDTMEQLEEDEYNKVTLIAKSFSSASKRIMGKEDALDMISPKISSYSTTEVYKEIQNLVASCCESECGGLPETEGDCKGFIDGKYHCDVRRISDDSDFHARMRWLPLVIKDFSRLVDLQSEMG